MTDDAGLARLSRDVPPRPRAVARARAVEAGLAAFNASAEKTAPARSPRSLSAGEGGWRRLLAVLDQNRGLVAAGAIAVVALPMTFSILEENPPSRLPTIESAPTDKPAAREETLSAPRKIAEARASRAEENRVAVVPDVSGASDVRDAADANDAEVFERTSRIRRRSSTPDADTLRRATHSGRDRIATARPPAQTDPAASPPEAAAVPLPAPTPPPRFGAQNDRFARVARPKSGSGQHPRAVRRSHEASTTRAQATPRLAADQSAAIVTLRQDRLAYRRLRATIQAGNLPSPNQIDTAALVSALARTAADTPRAPGGITLTRLSSPWDGDGIMIIAAPPTLAGTMWRASLTNAVPAQERASNRQKSASGADAINTAIAILFTAQPSAREVSRTVVLTPLSQTRAPATPRVIDAPRALETARDPEQRFRLAVVAYAEKLRGNADLASFRWGQIADLADEAVSDPQDRERSAFVNLVRITGALARLSKPSAATSQSPSPSPRPSRPAASTPSQQRPAAQ